VRKPANANREDLQTRPEDSESMVAVQWFGRDPRAGCVYTTRYPGRVLTNLSCVSVYLTHRYESDRLIMWLRDYK
jgi:hypothetical protein